MKEEVRRIRDTEYFINQFGDVFNKHGKKLSPWKEVNTGYWLIRIRIDKKAKCFRVHRLLSEAWIPNPNGYKFVKHLDDDKNNLSLSNLEWGTNSQNTKEGYNNDCYQFKNKNSYPIEVTSKTDPMNSMIYKSLRECNEKTGIDRKKISAILKGKCNNLTDYNFKYVVSND